MEETQATEPLLIDVPEGFTDYASDAVVAVYIKGQTSGGNAHGQAPADSSIALRPVQRADCTWDKNHPWYMDATVVDGMFDVWASAVEPGTDYGFDGDYDLHMQGPLWECILWLAACRTGPGDVIAAAVARCKTALECDMINGTVPRSTRSLAEVWPIIAQQATHFEDVDREGLGAGDLAEVERQVDEWLREQAFAWAESLERRGLSLVKQAETIRNG